MTLRRLLPLISAWVFLRSAQVALACSACYGQSDSSLAKGMNMGIFTLLGVIGLMLVGIAGFFVFIIRRAATMQAASPAASDSN